MVVKDHRTIPTADVAVLFGLSSYSSYALTTTVEDSSAADAEAAADYSAEWAATMTEWVANVLLSFFYFSSAVAVTTAAAAKKHFLPGAIIFNRPFA